MSDQENLPVLKPKEIIDAPAEVASDILSVDHLVSEYARIAFDRTEKPSVRIAALRDLGKYKGMFIERTESRTIDATKQAALLEMFKTMSLEEKRAWLKDHQASLEAATMNTPQHAKPTLDLCLKK